MKSQATAIQVTIGAVARTPKMIPNFRKSMRMSNRVRPRLEVPQSVHERTTGLTSGRGSLEAAKEGVEVA